MKKFTLIIFVLSLININSLDAQVNTQEEDREKVEKAVLNWADSTFKEYDHPRFEKFRASYTDEYLMASMRAKGIDDRIHELKKEYSSGKYTGTEQEFTDTMEDLKKRKAEAEENMEDFHPKVTNYSINFWANIKLDSGISNYVNHKIILDDNFRVIKSQIVGNIGDNTNAKIIYK